jgi:DNA polymerase III alpha subunit
MTNRIESKIPFVGLHAHSGLSPFDGLGMPGEHMDFAYENGMNAHSLTDHGHMNGLSFQVEHLKKMRAEGKEFKPSMAVSLILFALIRSGGRCMRNTRLIKSGRRKKSLAWSSKMRTAS